MSLPSGETATRSTRPRCPCSCRSSLPLATSQRHMPPFSDPADARPAPSCETPSPRAASAVPLDAAQLVARGDIPQPGGAVAAGGGQPLAVARKRDDVDHVLVPGQLALLACRPLVQDDPVRGAPGDVAAVRGKGDGVQPRAGVAVGPEAVEFLPRGRVPEADHAKAPR